MMNKRFYWFELSLGIAILISHAYVAFAPKESLLMWFRNDDAFFYFKVAENISMGLGSTFDGLGLANGYHPLWMLVCLPVFALARFDLYLPLRILTIILAVLNLGTGIFLFRLLKQFTRQPIAMLAAAFWVFYPNIHAQTTQGGLETGINVFFTTWLLYALTRLQADKPPTSKQLAQLGGLASLTVLSRLDNIFLLLILGIWTVWRNERFRNQAIAYILLTTLGVLLSFIARLGLKGFYDFAIPAMAMIVISLAIRLPVYYFAGLTQLDWTYPRKTITRILITVTGASVLVGSLMLAIGLIPAVNGFPRSTLLVDWAIALLSALLISIMQVWLSKQEENPVSPWEYFKSQWQNWLKRALIYFGILGGVIVIYMLINYALFETPMPISGQIKQWWGSIDTVYGKRVKDLDVFLGFNSAGRVIAFATLYEILILFFLPETIPFWTLLVIYLAIGLVLLANRNSGFRSNLDRSGWLALVAGALIHIWSYNARGYVAIREWYWTAQMLTAVISMTLFWDAILKNVPAKVVGAISTLLVFLILLTSSLSISKLVPYDTAQLSEDLTAEIRFLEANTEPGSLIGMTGGGMNGYFIKERTIINLDGLINSVDYYRLHKQFKSYEYLEVIGLDYVFGNAYIVTESDPYGRIFVGRLTPVKVFNSPHTLFKYQAAP